MQRGEGTLEEKQMESKSLLENMEKGNGNDILIAAAADTKHAKYYVSI